MIDNRKQMWLNLKRNGGSTCPDSVHNEAWNIHSVEDGQNLWYSMGCGDLPAVVTFPGFTTFLLLLVAAICRVLPRFAAYEFGPEKYDQIRHPRRCGIIGLQEAGSDSDQDFIRVPRQQFLKQPAREAY